MVNIVDAMNLVTVRTFTFCYFKNQRDYSKQFYIIWNHSYFEFKPFF